MFTEEQVQRRIEQETKRLLDQIENLSARFEERRLSHLAKAMGARVTGGMPRPPVTVRDAMEYQARQRANGAEVGATEAVDHVLEEAAVSEGKSEMTPRFIAAKARDLQARQRALGLPPLTATEAVSRVMEDSHK